MNGRFSPHPFLAAILLGQLATSAYASGINVDTQNGAGVGYSFAGVSALAQNASTVASNPAGMLLLDKGQHISASTAYVSAETTFSSTGTSAINPLVPLGSSSDSIQREAVIPSLQYAYNPGNKLAFGISVLPLYGNKGEWDSNFFGRYQGLKTEVAGINYNAAVAYELSPQLLFGLGLDYLTFDATLTRKAGPVLNTGSNPPVYITDINGELKGDGDGWGANAGIIWQPTSNLNIGLTYRSQVDLNLQGSLNLSSPVSSTHIPAEVDISMPQSVTLGAAWRLNPQWQALAEVAWYDWSVLPSFKAVSVQSGAVVYSEQLNFKDGLRGSLGAQYQLNDKTQLRFGSAYDKSVVESAQDRTVRFPDADRIWLSLGAGYQLSPSLSVDAGYAHVFANKTSIQSPTVIAGKPTAQTVQGTFDTSADIFSLQLNYKF